MSGYSWWCVWDPSMGVGRFQYGSEEGAIEEAKEMARANVPQVFVVMKATHRVYQSAPLIVDVFADPPEGTV